MDEIEQKEQEYKAYIDEHCENIKKIWNNVHSKINAVTWLDDCTWHTINNNVYCHDESKYETEEFEGYRRNFHPAIEEPKSQYMFDYAWNHHQKTNKHHWEYWVIVGVENKPLPMPFVCVVEMLCDWAAMSLTLKDVPSDFYNSKKGTMVLHETTIKFIERIIYCFDESVKELLN